MIETAKPTPAISGTDENLASLIAAKTEGAVQVRRDARLTSLIQARELRQQLRVFENEPVVRALVENLGTRGASLAIGASGRRSFEAAGSAAEFDRIVRIDYQLSVSGAGFGIDLKHSSGYKNTGYLSFDYTSSDRLVAVPIDAGGKILEDAGLLRRVGAKIGLARNDKALQIGSLLPIVEAGLTMPEIKRTVLAEAERVATSRSSR